MAYHHNPPNYAPYQRRRNLDNTEMNAILMDYAICHQLIATVSFSATDGSELHLLTFQNPPHNGHMARTAIYQQIHAHLATIIRLGSSPYTPDGRHQIMMLLVVINQIRHNDFVNGYQN